MVKNKLNYGIIFSGESVKAIQNLLEKYGLDKRQEEKLTELAKTKKFTEKEMIFEDLPGRKIARIVKEVAENKIKVGNLSSELQKRLNISKEKAESLAKELETQILLGARKVLIEEETLPVESAPIVKSLPVELEKTAPIQEEELKAPQKKDTYHEPIE